MICSEKEIIKALKKGEVVGIPTDTVYGFACLKENIDNVYKLKKRDKKKKLISFIYKTEQVGTLDDFNKDESKDIFKNYWPGNNTLIFNKDNTLVSYRMPNEKNVLSLLKEIDEILLTTSANKSGENACETKEEFEIRFPNIKLLEEKEKSIKSKSPSNIFIIKKDSVEKIR